jgi:hypothetical protein
MSTDRGRQRVPLPSIVTAPALATPATMHAPVTAATSVRLILTTSPPRSALDPPVVPGTHGGPGRFESVADLLRRGPLG